ncbi:MAG: non-canonical purine NTP diphosphatase [Bacteroidetes bacterium]|nr:non-canonical purine NTP diphosphatase [Bacteroidota bacterium]
MQLVFATNNPYKLNEVRELLHKKISLLSLSDIRCFEELSETGNSLEENAKQKAKFVHEKYNVNCFADDTGLEIESLNGKPGVLSARYAGEQKSFEDNIQKVLAEMKNIENRKAKFRTVIYLFLNNEEYFFEGSVKGIILKEKRGKDGFGYDPIFQPDGFQKSFAEMTLEEKNKISHRAVGIKKLAAFLNKMKN